MPQDQSRRSWKIKAAERDGIGQRYDQQSNPETSRVAVASNVNVTGTRPAQSQAQNPRVQMQCRVALVVAGGRLIFKGSRWSTLRGEATPKGPFIFPVLNSTAPVFSRPVGHAFSLSSERGTYLTTSTFSLPSSLIYHITHSQSNQSHSTTIYFTSHDHFTYNITYSPLREKKAFSPPLRPWTSSALRKASFNN